ncbi:hypothetical protein D3C80_1614400 [compost metagenome]
MRQQCTHCAHAQRAAQQVRPFHRDFRGAEQQRFDASQRGFNRMEGKHRCVMSNGSVREGDFRQLLLAILKDQFIFVFLTNILEISYTANDRAILHMNNQVIAAAFITGDIFHRVMNNHNAGFIHGNSRISLCSEFIFQRCFTRNNIHGFAHAIFLNPCYTCGALFQYCCQ